MGLAGRATVDLSLALHRQVHIVEGDESGAFDMAIRSGLARFSELWPGQCGWRRWVQCYYGRRQVQLWTTKGLAPAIVPQLGCWQGCKLAATRYLDLGKLRTRGLRTRAQGWTEAGIHLAEVVFSDNRRWFGRTNREVASVVTVAQLLAQDACAPSHPGKTQVYSGSATLQLLLSTPIPSGEGRASRVR